MVKGQFKIQQMAFMLMAVVLFFILVLLFFLLFQSRGLKDKATELRMQKSISMAQILASTPEFTCGDYCIDTDRLMVLINRSAYMNSKFWAVSKIEIIEMYPREGNTICNFMNYPDCDIYKVYELNEKGSSVDSFVSLCRREEREGSIYEVCRLGKIIVGFKSE